MTWMTQIRRSEPALVAGELVTTPGGGSCKASRLPGGDVFLEGAAVTYYPPGGAESSNGSVDRWDRCPIWTHNDVVALSSHCDVNPAVNVDLRRTRGGARWRMAVDRLMK
ncbi:hypothetical protein M6B38_395655 [Iris pallida]|uniref:Uncharacterized protein n=1 Tax=Iris pallida TaxID=29817 RepID=A0AAX6FXG2_IRIPA|nr:hypothetical protein M6B38_395655 [Iris pallida]